MSGWKGKGAFWELGLGWDWRDGEGDLWREEGFLGFKGSQGYFEVFGGVFWEEEGEEDEEEKRRLKGEERGFLGEKRE